MEFFKPEAGRFEQVTGNEILSVIETKSHTQPARIIKGYPYSGKSIPKTINRPVMAKADIEGKRYGKLTVIEDLGALPNGWRLWGCLCDCGRKKAVRSRELRRGNTKSCGCLWYEKIMERPGANKMLNGEAAFNCYYQSYKKSARLRNYEWSLNIKEFRELSQQECYYCGQPPLNIVYERKGYTNGGYKTNGIDRIDNSKGYTVDNVRPCCKQCNIAKGILSEDVFYKWIERVAEAKSARFEFGERGE